MDTFAVITTDPNELLAEKTGHDRMPVIVKRTDYQRWLEPSDKAHLPVDLLRPFDSDQMKAWRLDRRVNNVRNNEPALWELLTEEEISEKPKPAKKSRSESKADDGSQMDMFG
jgi:putative SOS response-associated peptidase YedK